MAISYKNGQEDFCAGMTDFFFGLIALCPFKVMILLGPGSDFSGSGAGYLGWT